MTAPACPLTATEARRLAEMKRLVLDGEPVGNALAFNAEYDGLATKLYGENQYSSVEALNLLADALDRAEKAEAERDFCKQAANDWRELYESSRPQRSRPISATNPGDEAVTK